MSEPTNNVTDNVALRYLIREATEREVQLQSIRLDQNVNEVKQIAQIARGMGDQLNRDYIQVTMRLSDLEELISGNPTRGIAGLIPTVAEIKKTLAEFSANAKTLKYLVGVLIALGVFDAVGITKWVQGIIGILP